MERAGSQDRRDGRLQAGDHRSKNPGSWKSIRSDEAAISAINTEHEPRLVTVADGHRLEVIPRSACCLPECDPRHPILLKDTLHPPSEKTDFLHALLPAAQNIGSLLCDGIGDAMLVRGETAPGQSLRLAYNILQAAGTRIFKTDYVACPSCGRTLFNLQPPLRKSAPPPATSRACASR